MSKITKITPAVCKKLRTEMEEELELLMDHLGLKVDIGNAKYSDNDVRFTVTVSLADFDKDRETFMTYAELFGLEKSDYGAVFQSGHQSYKLIGINPNAPKYPLVAKSLKDGREYRFTRYKIAAIKAARDAA